MIVKLNLKPCKYFVHANLILTLSFYDISRGETLPGLKSQTEAELPEIEQCQ